MDFGSAKKLTEYREAVRTVARNVYCLFICDTALTWSELVVNDSIEF